MPDCLADSIQLSSFSVVPQIKMPRNLIARLRIAAKSGVSRFSASTSSACRAVSNGRGLMQSAAATSGDVVWWLLDLAVKTRSETLPINAGLLRLNQ